ncbi:RING-type domain-containing protein [Aphelenchoides bicaudatus]|nr:RING-type domain-containing protein [Aphelenchoides bicaudatus]
MRSCPKCKSNEYSNRSLVMLINECGHPLCQNCVDNIFARNANNCPYQGCEKVLKKNTFWPQMFDDPQVEKETFIRRRVMKIYNLMEDDFPTLKDYNDYLEHIEEIIFKLVNNEDVAQIEEEMRSFREEHSDSIERNRRRMNADDRWISEMLDEEAKAQARNEMEYNNDLAMDDINVKPRSIISELRDSDVPAEMILKRKRSEERNERILARQPHQSTSFGPVRISGKPYHHVFTPLVFNGPVMPTIHELSNSGYLNYVRKPEPGALAAGFRHELACYRALFESRWDLFLV